MTDIYLNEKFIGYTQKPKDFIKGVRKERRSGKLPIELNISYDENYSEILIDISKARARRPLIIVENGKSLLTDKHIEKLKSKELTWEKLVKEGIIEYLDAAEEETTYISLSEEELTKDHTHLEINPITILGTCSSLIPHANFGGSSRLIRGNKIQKQALGLYASNYLLRMDTDVSVLHYPQVPLTKSFMHDIVDYSRHPAGQNVIIAVMCCDGYNMEDAIVMNKASLERGLSRSTYFRPYSAEELRYSGGLVDEVCIPEKEVKGYKSEKDYRLLEDDGIVYTGARVKEGDVIIGKVSPPRFLGELEEFSIAANIKRESSILLGQGQTGIIDCTIITENEEGNIFVQTRLREQRISEIGDKFASRHGQKGVISHVVNSENIPFSASGITPDILFSPHSIPSRMTISHIIEILAGKVGALSGSYMDGTTFDAVSEKELRKILKTYGFRENGVETFYNGVTGEEFKARIYVGSMYYLKLKHMVANKIHSRAGGRVQLLTRQPLEGRAQGGGLRLGEMEKDCFVAYGASLLLKERFDSDKTVLYVCEECGLLSVYDVFKNRPTCPRCGSKAVVTKVEMSYAFKLLLDELKSLCIYPRLILKEKY